MYARTTVYACVYLCIIKSYHGQTFKEIIALCTFALWDSRPFNKTINENENTTVPNSNLYLARQMDPVSIPVRMTNNLFHFSILHRKSILHFKCQNHLMKLETEREREADRFREFVSMFFCLSVLMRELLFVCRIDT